MAHLDDEDIRKLTGSRISYRYRELQLCSDDEVTQYAVRTRELFDTIAREFDDARNTEWFIRSYLALKFVLGSTLLANSGVYAEERNLQVVEPYLGYYTILNCCRSFLLTSPCVDWRSERTIEMTHSNILNLTTDKLRRLGRRHAEHFGTRMRAALGQRELFSYRFPATGLAMFGEDYVDIHEAIEIARLLTELAQVNLACLEGRVGRHRPGSFKLLELEDMWHTMRYETKTGLFIDDEDYHRVGYFVRKYHGPIALVAFAKDGLLDEFFGAWEAEDCDEASGGAFNPDRDISLLLNV